jgi:hypothetical protein
MTTSTLKSMIMAYASYWTQQGRTRRVEDDSVYAAPMLALAQFSQSDRHSIP